MNIEKPTGKHHLYMRTAIRLAKKSNPSPNPKVGAVVVKNGQVIGQGYHLKPGTPHAEVHALNQAGKNAIGATLYVTLEPCCHTGRTGPCTKQIIAAGISKVYIGMLDPDSQVSGNGVKELTHHGIKVETGLLETDCRSMLAGYITHRTLGRPRVNLKAAATLDGFIATKTGDSKWITSLASRTYVHQMRAESDAILVGINTVLKDDPDLTVRHVQGQNPIRVIMDTNLRTPLDSNLVKTAETTPVIIAHGKDADNEKKERLRQIDGITTLECSKDCAGHIDPKQLLFKLAAMGILTLMIEGGGKIHGAFVKANLADSLSLFVSPKIIGDGIKWLHYQGVNLMDDAVSLEDLTTQKSGNDLLIQGTFSILPLK